MFSKSLYTRGLQCPKSLWLKKYKSSVLATPDSSREAIFSNGDEVGILARSLFPNGKEIKFEGSSFEEKIKQSKEWIEQGENVIYEATFKYDDVLVMVDILTFVDGKAHIYEVKSSTSIKEVYQDDASIQYYVLNGLGYEVGSTNIVYINSDYIRDENLDIAQLFIIEDISEIIKEKQKNIPYQLQNFRKLLKNDEPQIEIGMHCLSPYECDACEYCWKDQRKIPDYSVFNIARLKWNKRFELYHSGITKLEEIKDLTPFNEGQRLQILSEKNPQIIIKKDKIQAFLSTLKYPIYHLDFETFQQSIPQWKGISPYEQIPFQYSLHIDYGDGRLEHREFLAQEGTDPREELVKSLLKDIPQDVMLMAYNASFERGVICKLAKTFEKYSQRLQNIASNIIDLMIPFAQKDYYHPDMQGSYSIKKVLPAIVPEMSEAYKKLNLIQNGGEAMESYASLHLMNEEQKSAYKEALLKYCHLDTLAMVKVLEKLKEVSILS